MRPWRTHARWHSHLFELGVVHERFEERLCGAEGTASLVQVRVIGDLPHVSTRPKSDLTAEAQGLLPHARRPLASMASVQWVMEGGVKLELWKEVFRGVMEGDTQIAQGHTLTRMSFLTLFAPRTRNWISSCDSLPLKSSACTARRTP